MSKTKSGQALLITAPCTISFGLTIHPSDGCTLIKSADRQLYQVKAKRDHREEEKDDD
jgi:GGDEF domain-containing protein